ncbi:MAG TPA: ABC transporter ATP-binding protein [Polyangiaceae bacterium]|nr:ABC transporter ATP-binding protein [Polyangiaceae bacterium]
MSSGEAASAPPLVELADIDKIYGHGESEVRALDGVTLEIRKGEFLAVMGASGSGKSTCMNVLGFLDRPTNGYYYFRGVDTGPLTLDELALLRQRFLGFVFQGFNLLARTTAVDNVELPLVYRGVPLRQRRERARRALARVGLSGREHHTPAELSGGQQQRVAIARAIVTEPSLVLADEPTGNLDSHTKGEIMRLLVELNREQGITVVMVTHETDMAEYASRIVWFKDGKIDRDHSTGSPS